MLIKTLRLRNFRNYEKAIIDFSKGINLFYGDNAQGKSNLLEAIYLFSVGKSFRTKNIKELIQRKKSFFSLDLLVEKEGIEQHYSIYYDNKEKKIFFNSQKCASFSQLIGLLPSTLLSSEDKQLIMGAPELRRRFINLHLAQRDPLYVYHYTRYSKALHARNTLLKRKKSSSLFVWEEELAKSALYLTEQRKIFIKDLSEKMRHLFSLFNWAGEEITLKYESPFDGLDKMQILALYEKMRPKDLYHGYTQLGPHRDDFMLLLKQEAMKHFASEGQKQIALYSLKFAAKELLGKNALFYIDDFSIHLDKSRKKHLVELLEKMPQVFVTTPEKENIVGVNYYNITSRDGNAYVT